MKTRKSALAAISLVALVAVLVVVPLLGASAQNGQIPGKSRIGIYDPRALAIAFVSGNGNNKIIEGLRGQLKDAESAKDEKKAAEIKAKGAKLQDLRHLQGFSNAPVDDILETIKAKLPSIAEAAKVDAIVAQIDFQSSAVEAVDVTDRLVAEFQPSEKTLKTIAELRKHAPYPMIDILGMKD